MVGSACRAATDTLAAVTRLRRLLRGFAAVAVLVLLAVGCSSDGFPVSYDDQIDAETGLSNVEQNWKQGCEPSLSEELAEQAVAICECSFTRIKADVPFDDFVEINDRLADDPDLLQDIDSQTNVTARQIVDIVKGCIADA